MESNMFAVMRDLKNWIHQVPVLSIQDNTVPGQGALFKGANITGKWQKLYSNTFALQIPDHL